MEEPNVVQFFMLETSSWSCCCLCYRGCFGINLSVFAFTKKNFSQKGKETNKKPNIFSRKKKIEKNFFSDQTNKGKRHIFEPEDKRINDDDDNNNFARWERKPTAACYCFVGGGGNTGSSQHLGLRWRLAKE